MQDADGFDQNGLHSIHRAASSGDVEKIVNLLDSHCDIDLPTKVN